MKLLLTELIARITIDEVKVKGIKLQLMKDVSGIILKEPHLLIGGGTGGGKTVVLKDYTLYALG